jgi:hypothetical protein
MTVVEIGFSSETMQSVLLSLSGVHGVTATFTICILIAETLIWGARILTGRERYDKKKRNGRGESYKNSYINDKAKKRNACTFFFPILPKI